MFAGLDFDCKLLSFPLHLYSGMSSFCRPTVAARKLGRIGFFEGVKESIGAHSKVLGRKPCFTDCTVLRSTCHFDDIFYSEKTLADQGQELLKKLV